MQEFWSSPNTPLKQHIPSLWHLAKQFSVRHFAFSSTFVSKPAKQPRGSEGAEKRFQKSLNLLHQRSGFRQHFGKRVAKDDGVFSFAVLYDIVSQVEEVQSVSEASWKQRKNTGQSLVHETLAGCLPRIIFKPPLLNPAVSPFITLAVVLPCCNFCRRI